MEAGWGYTPWGGGTGESQGLTLRGEDSRRHPKARKGATHPKDDP